MSRPAWSDKEDAIVHRSWHEPDAAISIRLSLNGFDRTARAVEFRRGQLGLLRPQYRPVASSVAPLAPSATQVVVERDVAYQRMLWTAMLAELKKPVDNGLTKLA